MPTPMTFFDLVTACFAAEDFSLRDHFDGVSQQLSRFGVLQGVRNTDWLSAVTLVATYHHRERVVKEYPLIAQIPTVGCGHQIIRDVKAFDGEIESHHVFPEAWCKQQGIPATRYNCLLNRTPLKKDTNRFIGSQPPSVYLARLVDEQGISKQRLNEILRSHYVEPKTLWSDDFDAFLDSRMGDLSLLIEEMMGIKLSRKNLVGIK